MVPTLTNPRLAERQKNAVYVFLHIPRTGGTSLIRTITHGLESDQYLDLSGEKRTTEVVARELAGLPPERVARLKFLSGQQLWYGVHEILGRPARYIAFLRTPAARVLSNYRQMRRDLDHPFNPAILRPCPTFAKYLSSPNHPLVANHMAVLLGRRGAGPGFSADDCWRVNNAWMERADVNLANFWFVGFQESFDADCRLLCERMGVAYTPHLERRSADEEPDDLQITAADVARCRELNWADGTLYELAQIRRGLGACIGAT